MQFFLRLGWVTPRKQAAFLPTSFILNHPLLLAWWLSRSQKNPETPGDHMQNNYWQVPLANLIITVQRAVLAHFEISLPVSLIGTPNNVSLMFSYNFSSCLCAWSEIWWETSENTLQQNLLHFCSLVSRTIFSLCSVTFENNDSKSEAGTLLPNCVLTFLWEVSTSEISKIHLQSQNDSFGTFTFAVILCNSSASFQGLSPSGPRWYLNFFYWNLSSHSNTIWWKLSRAPAYG